MKVLTAVFLAALVTAEGCPNPAGPDQVVLAKPFELAVGHTAELPDGLRLKFDRVGADSRCPIDVQCVSAGDATVLLNASREGGTPVPLELHTKPGGSQISYASHTIQLTSLQPQRRSNSEPRAIDYVATLVVSAP